MPLLNKKPFEPKRLSKDLKDNCEIFYNPLTGEAFEDYDEFCERVYLCNSLQWTCTITGKTGQTYKDAVLSEENAQKMLQEFPMELRLPVLYLASLTDRLSLKDMADDVFAFTRGRFFVGEMVEVQIKNLWQECHILQVKLPSSHELNKAAIECSKATKNDRIFFPPENMYQYEVEVLDDSDGAMNSDAVYTVKADKVRRKKFVYTREKNKLFIRQFVENASPYGHGNTWKIKESVRKQYNLNKSQWNNIFIGTEPKFYKHPVKEPSVNARKRAAGQQLTMDNFVTKKSSPTKMPNGALQQKKDKAGELEKKRITLEEIERKKKEERLELQEKKKQEKLKLAEFMKEYQKKKEDLELEDLKELPEPAGITMKLPNKYFGQLAQIHEFVNVYSKIIERKRYFSGGLTFEILENALSDYEVEGPLNDLVQLLLSAVYTMLDLELDEIDDHKSRFVSQGTMDKQYTESSDPELNKLLKLADKAMKWVTQTQGCRFPNIPVDCFSISEVLRLHLMCSGGIVGDVTARWRFEQRGGYRCFDDPGVLFRQRRPDVMEHLAVNSIYELSLDDKLELLQVLIDQVLTYANVRDIIDEKMENARQNRADFRLHYFAQMKKEREEVFKLKEEKKTNKEKDKLDDIDKEIAEIIEKNKEKLQNESNKIAILGREAQLVPLGYDRAFRRYWVFKSLPGLYVEHNPQYVGECIPGGTPCIDSMNMPDTDTLEYMKRLFDDSNNKENLGNRTLVKDVLSTPVKNFVREGVPTSTATPGEEKSKRVPYTCTGDMESCRVHGIAPTTVWYYFKSEIEIDQLIACLNDRGFREHDLKEALIQERDRILKGLPNCPLFLSQDEKMYIDDNKESVTKILDLALRDQLLDMEYKITAGGLGNLKVDNPAEWRKKLEEGVFDESCESLWPDETNIPEEESEETEGGNNPSPKLDYKFIQTLDAVYCYNINEEIRPNVRCMKTALLQLEQSITPKFFGRPLGNVTSKRTSKKPSDLYLKWEASLKRCTSLSQIFIHLVALEKSILWSKSLLKTNCKLCKTRADPEQMLLCDSCDKGFHTYCLTPKLKKIPGGDWHCPACRPILKKEKEIKEKKAKKESAAVVEDEKKTVFGKCKICLDKVPLIQCDSCTQGYHMACLEPPLRKIPRGTWSCHNCRRNSAVLRKDTEDEGDFLRGSSRRNARAADTEDEPDFLRVSSRRSARAATSKITQYAQQILSNNMDDDGDEYDDDDESGDDLNNSISAPTTERTKRKARNSIEPIASDLPLDNAVLQELLEKLMHDKNAWPFLRPVTKNEVPDYHLIITNPMDFAKIKHKLNMLQYRNNSEVLYDCNLVFDNCFAYNKEDSEIHEAGEKLKKLFDKLCKERHLFFIEEDMSIDSKPAKRRKK